MSFPFALSTPGGGTEDATELARAMARLGADVTLVTPDCDGPDRFPRRRARQTDEGRERFARLAEAGVRRVTSAPHPLHFRLDGVGVRAAVGRLLEQVGPDRAPTAVLGYWHEACLLPQVARARAAGFAMVGTASFSQFFGPGRGPLQRLRNRRLARTYRAARVVFARSEFSRAELREHLEVDAARVRVVPLGVDPCFLAVERAGPPPAPEPVRRLVFVGRLVESKGVYDALEALHRVRRGGEGLAPAPGLGLRLVGPGDPAPVRARARELGLEGVVELVGNLGREDLARELAAAQLALLPTHTESFGLAVAEAQAAGLAVVGYAAGAVPEVVVDGETGWLAEAGRPERLADVLGRALADPGAVAAAGASGRARAAEHYSWRRAAELTLAGLAEAAPA